MPTSRHFTTLLATGVAALLAITATLFITAGAAASPMPEKLSLPPAPTTKHVPVPPHSTGKPESLYVVKSGDTLTLIATRLYHQPIRRADIWWINRKRVPNPNLIFVGERLWTNTEYPPRWMIRRFNEAASPAITAVSTTPTTTVSYTPVTAPSGSFESCVMQRESGGVPTAWYPAHTDGSLPPPYDSVAEGLFGFLLSTWQQLGLGYNQGASYAPASIQIEGFNKLYAESGSAPWAGDGC